MSKKCTPLWREAHFQVKCTKHTSFGLLLAVEMLKKCTPLWHEAHFQAKMYKTHHVRTTFWRFGCRKSARRCGAKHISKSKCTKHTMFGPLLEVQMSLRFNTLHYRTLHYTTLQLHNYTTTQLHSYTTTQLHNYTTTLHYTPLH